MGIFKFSMRMLVKDYKKSLFYGITLIFAVAVCFVFFNIINNPDLADQAIARSGGTWSDVQMPFSSVLSFLIICFCCFMVFFANDFFLSRKTTGWLLWQCQVLAILIQQCMSCIKHSLCCF